MSNKPGNVQILKYELYHKRSENKFIVCVKFVVLFFAECKLHQTNCEYSLLLIVPYKSCQKVLSCIITFSNFTPLQSPTGGTSGLCFKKLNITTSAYRIIINRLDRKVNLFT